MADYSARGYAGKLGWSVGIHSWLDREESRVARYWRVIEFGSEATKWPWKGANVVGLWGPDAEPRKGLIRDGLAPFGERRDQKFVPFFSKIGATDEELEKAGRAALWALTHGGRDLSMFKPDGRGNSRNEQNERRRIFFYMMTRATLEEMPFVSGIIQKDVKARNFYAEAITRFDPMRTELEMLRQEIGWMLGGADITSAKGRQIIRKEISEESGAPMRKGRWGNEGGASHAKHLNVGRSTSPAVPAIQGPLISVNASIYVRDMIRDGNGRFSPEFFTKIVYEVNRRVAAAFQDEVVGLMKRERKRPPTGNLINATASPNNRFPH